MPDVQIAVAKTNKYASRESGDTVEVVTAKVEMCLGTSPSPAMRRGKISSVLQTVLLMAAARLGRDWIE